MIRQRQPREHDEEHLAFIRRLPCVIPNCGDNVTVEAAHIRYGSPDICKPITGMGRKPDDKFTVPLCGKHHREQHNHGNEIRWWNLIGLDPIRISLALYAVSGDYERGEAIALRRT